MHNKLCTIFENKNETKYNYLRHSCVSNTVPNRWKKETQNVCDVSHGCRFITFPPVHVGTVHEFFLSVDTEHPPCFSKCF